MNKQERTLDLTMFNRRNFAGKFRLRYLFDWVNDYWEKGYTLTKIKLSNDEYEDLLDEVRKDNIYIKELPTDTSFNIETGINSVEIQRGELL